MAISFEKFFTEQLFKSDLTKAVYATTDYAFRRRFELIDTNKNWETVEASSLQFPFMSYHVGDTWKPIPNKRIFAMEEFGVTSVTEASSIRMIQAENKVNVVLYYDREDDARFAYDVLAFMSSQKRWSKQEVTYLHEQLELPVSFTIDAEKISYNPKIQENDWLKENRIFVLSFEVEVASMIMAPPLQFADDSEYNPTPFVITETVVMEFLNGKSTSILEVSDIISDDTTITLDMFELDRATKTTAKLKWQFQNQGALDSLLLKINGKEYDLSVMDYKITIRGLLSGAQYTADLYATKNGASKHYVLKFSTTSDATKDSDIVGTTWQ